jgi:hypothetical protein
VQLMQVITEEPLVREESQGSLPTSQE